MVKKAHLLMKVLVFSCFTMLLILIAVDAFAVSMETKIVSAHGGLNVRREPNAQSQRVYVLDETEIVVILEWRDGWARVANNYPPYLPIGWACGDYLK